ncbi:MAG: hypothetical protein LLG05_17130 [Porphyromonadaceae bacterium]|nr:hypothetical protein [Porphyromonadaceae bacterium]
MKRKNLFFVSALILLGLATVNSVKAQNITANATATVNIKIKPVMSIVVRYTSGSSVDLVYATKEAYESGVRVTIDDHLKVFSTGGFIVTVKTDGKFKRGGVDEGAINASDVIVSATAGSNVKDGVTYSAAAGLTSTDPGNTLITATKGGRDLTYDVTYDNTAGKDDKYIDNYIDEDDIDGSVYTAQVTYTITAD